MKAPMPVASGVSRGAERFRHPWKQPQSQVQNPSRTHLSVIAPQRPVRFPARIAEFLLVLRLRARRRSASSADVLERAVRVVFVTCQHWFGISGESPRHRSGHSD
jgi:hypothetical protein